MIHRLYFSVLLILWYFVGKSQIEGVLQTTSYSPNFNGKYVEQRKNKIWFKDSAVIYEFRVEKQSYGSISEGTIVKSGYPVVAYFYLDLRSMMYQQYADFKDTTMPMYNIALKPGDHAPFWRFYHSKNAPQDNTEQMAALPDTIIENILYKRIKVPYKKNPKESSYSVYYIQCNAPKSIFHMMPALEQLYPGCKAIRSEFVYVENPVIRVEKQVARVFEYKIINNRLTEFEIRIFKNWAQNAKNTKLPIMSFDEAFSRGFSDNVKLDEKPIITILPHDSTFWKPQPITKITQNDVERWMLANMNSSTPLKNTLIKKVLQNARFDKMYAEILREHEKENLIVVPLKNEPVSQHFTVKNPPLQYLILVENAKGEIRRGDIILFYSDKLLKTLPKNTFFNLFNSDFNSEDGTYALITQGDGKQWEMDFKNHQKTEFRLWFGEKIRSDCKSWYLETSKYRLWGQIEQSKKYLGDTCTGCPPNQLCD